MEKTDYCQGCQRNPCPLHCHGLGGNNTEAPAPPQGSPSKSSDLLNASRLRALLEGLEVQYIDEALENTPEMMMELGAEIAKAAKLGVVLYLAQKKAGI